MEQNIKLAQKSKRSHKQQLTKSSQNKERQGDHHLDGQQIPHFIHFEYNLYLMRVLFTHPIKDTKFNNEKTYDAKILNIVIDEIGWYVQLVYEPGQVFVLVGLYCLEELLLLVGVKIYFVWELDPCGQVLEKFDEIHVRVVQFGNLKDDIVHEGRHHA